MSTFTLFITLRVDEFLDEYLKKLKQQIHQTYGIPFESIQIDTGIIKQTDDFLEVERLIDIFSSIQMVEYIFLFDEKKDTVFVYYGEGELTYIKKHILPNTIAILLQIKKESVCLNIEDRRDVLFLRKLGVSFN